MKSVIFQLRQSNGNNVRFSFKSIPDGINQDIFVGTYLFPALIRLVKGASGMFDRALPIQMSFAAENDDDTTVSKIVGNVTLKTSSVHAVRRAVLSLNEMLAAMVPPTKAISAYVLVDMKGDKGREYRVYANSLLRPSVPLIAALSN